MHDLVAAAFLVVGRPPVCGSQSRLLFIERSSALVAANGRSAVAVPRAGHHGGGVVTAHVMQGLQGVDSWSAVV